MVVMALVAWAHSMLNPRPFSAGQTKKERELVLMYGLMSLSRSTNPIWGQSRP